MTTKPGGFPATVEDYVENIHAVYIITFSSDFMKAIPALDSYNGGAFRGISQKLRDAREKVGVKELIRLNEKLEDTIEDLAYWRLNSRAVQEVFDEFMEAFEGFIISEHCPERLKEEIRDFKETASKAVRLLLKAASTRTHFEFLIYQNLLDTLDLVFGEELPWGVEAMALGDLFSSKLLEAAERQRLLTLIQRRDQLVKKPTPAGVKAYVDSLEAFQGLFPAINFPNSEEFQASLLVEILWREKAL